MLVQWQGKQQEDVIWVDADIFKEQFPRYGLEDKSTMGREGALDNPESLLWLKSGQGQ